MKTLIVAAICCLLTFILPTVAYPISAQWDLDPISGDWNTADNWTPNGVSNGPADIATFGLSNNTFVSTQEDVEVNSIIFTPAATNPYTIRVGGSNQTPITLTLSGAGIINNSGIPQTFVLDSLEVGARMRFTHGASAGNARISLAATATLSFFNRSTASSASITGGDDGASTSVRFFNASTAGSAVIELFQGNELHFSNNSTAGNATLKAGDLGVIRFHDHSSAGNATIMNSDFSSESGILFSDSSTAGGATIQGNVFSTIVFGGLSKGGTAAIGLSVFSNLDISGHDAPGVTIGSLEGDETSNVFLGGNNLTVGSNDLSTTFSGVIEGPGGSLTKIGTGTLILSGANTYTGDTNVKNRGVLQIDGSISSNTSVHGHSVLAGTGTINGNVTNTDFGTVRPGGALGAPGVLTVVHNYTQTQYATLMIQIAGMSPDQFSVLNVLGNANLNGFLDPVLLNGFVPTIGDSFTFLNYASLTGEFSHIKHRVFDNGTLQWSVIYEANHAILTVEQHVPDQGSTFVLLTLGFFALVAYRKTKRMKPLTEQKKATGLFLIALACFPLSPIAQAVSPPPDGGYPNENTAEGDGALFSLTIGAANTAVGADALYFNTTGDDNVATGYAALHSNTIGYYNTATGAYALQNNTSNQNTANGYSALRSNTTGHYNTATGVDALFSNTTGASDTATGALALFRNTVGAQNTATGGGALQENTTGNNDTASGFQALGRNTTGNSNTASGFQALGRNTTGNANTANGARALFYNTTGSQNMATGASALFNNTTGNGNSAEGVGALQNNAGSFNTALGLNAGANLTTGSYNIDIGALGVAGESNTMRIGTLRQTATFIAGISGAVVTGAPVVVNAAGQLGVAPSSERFKSHIEPMDSLSEAILALKPVSFCYEQDIDREGLTQFGLVAEDVAKVNPDLVVRDDKGEIYTVRYEAINAMLLNEFLKEHAAFVREQRKVEQLEKQVERLTAGLQKVSAQLEASKPAPQVVNNP